MSDIEVINAKLDALHVFDAGEVQKIKAGIVFVEAFDGNPETLVRVARAFRAVEGWVTVTQKVGLVIAFIVLLLTNWDRVTEWLPGSKP